MKDFSVSDIFASVKCEFVRRCSHSESILTRLADDFIGRYSAKHCPHPQFFKEDAALTHNQLVMYADECIQVMRKFDFLSVGAEIIAGLTSSSFRILDFLAKQLYHRMRETPTALHKTTNESLCSGCSRLKENEHLRSLREQLSMQPQVWDSEKNLRELVTRKGEKYDEEELLQETLESLEALNEEEIRKKLGKMETDHDKRKKEILVAVQELTRANERVTTYSRAIQKSGKEISGKFNIKDYVFQLGRHFFHNISNLDARIKQLKQSILPIDHYNTQTDSPVILLEQHDAAISALNAEQDRLKKSLSSTANLLVIEQRKCSELRQLNDLLQQKLQESDVKRQHQKIQEKITLTHIKSILAAAQNRNNALESLLRKAKANKGREQEILQQIPNKQETVSLPDDLQASCDSRQSKERHHGMISRTLSYARDSFVMNPRAFLRMSHPHKSTNQQLTDRLLEVMPTAHEIFSKICEETKFHLSIHHIVSEVYFPQQRPKSKCVKVRQSVDKQVNTDQPIRGQEKSEQLQKEGQNAHNRRERKKLSRIDVGKYESIRTSKYRESIYVEQPEVISDLQKKKSSEKLLAFQQLKNSQEKMKLTSKKTLNTLNTLNTFKATQGLASIKQEDILKKHLLDRSKLDKKRKFKKARNMSQQNSYELCDEYQDIRKSIDRMDHPEKAPLGQRQKQILVNSIDGDLKLALRSSVHRSDCARVVLSLQQINYSTYFYSLLANLHLRSHSLYQAVRRFMIALVPGLSDDETSIKESLNCVLLAHRRCNSGSVCSHLQSFLERVRTL